MLLAMLYCIVFFALPVVGIMTLTLQKVYKDRRTYGERDKDLIGDEAEKGKEAARLPVLSNMKIIQYQLIESQVHEPLHFRDFKEKAPARAGP